MPEINLPDVSLQWSSAGDILKPSDAKIQQGWQVEIPPRQWFNWLDNRQDQAIAHIAQHGIAVWSPALEYQANKSYVQGSDGVVYKALTTNTNTNPVGDSTSSWAAAFTNSTETTRIDIPSTNNINLNNIVSRNINITGSSTISGFTVASGRIYFVRFASSATLINNTSLITQSGSNITTFAGDTCIIRALSNNIVEILCYTPGTPQELGYRQSWQDLTTSRTWATTYTNNSGRAIQVSVVVRDPNGGNLSFSLRVSGLIVAQYFLGTGTTATVSAIVPTGAEYRLERQDNNDTIVSWTELR